MCLSVLRGDVVGGGVSPGGDLGEGRWLTCVLVMYEKQVVVVLGVDGCGCSVVDDDERKKKKRERY